MSYNYHITGLDELVRDPNAEQDQHSDLSQWGLGFANGSEQFYNLPARISEEDLLDEISPATSTAVADVKQDLTALDNSVYGQPLQAELFLN